MSPVANELLVSLQRCAALRARKQIGDVAIGHVRRCEACHRDDRLRTRFQLAAALADANGAIVRVAVLPLTPLMFAASCGAIRVAAAAVLKLRAAVHIEKTPLIHVVRDASRLCSLTARAPLMLFAEIVADVLRCSPRVGDT